MLLNISKQGKLIPHYLRLEEAVDLAHSSLEEASQDLYTGGLDFAVVTPREIIGFGSEIKSRIDEAKVKSKGAKKKVKRKLKISFYI